VQHSRFKEVSLISACPFCLCVWLFRPPGTARKSRSGRAYVLPVMLSFFRHSFSELRRPIALKLCHMVGIWCNFIITLQKFRGLSPQKNWGQKHAKFPSILDHFRLRSRISPEPLKISAIGRRYKLWEFLLRLMKKSGALWSTNGLELHVSLDPLKCTFLADYISAHRGCCDLIFLHALEIDQALLAHTPTGTGVPQKFFKGENLKFGLKFSVYTSISSEQMGIPSQVFIQTTCREPGVITWVQFVEGLPPKI